MHVRCAGGARSCFVLRRKKRKMAGMVSGKVIQIFRDEVWRSKHPKSCLLPPEFAASCTPTSVS